MNVEKFPRDFIVSGNVGDRLGERAREGGEARDTRVETTAQS